jgi:hypothetical protein
MFTTYKFTIEFIIIVGQIKKLGFSLRPKLAQSREASATSRFDHSLTMDQHKPTIGGTALYRAERVTLLKRDWIEGDLCASWSISEGDGYVLESNLCGFLPPFKSMFELAREKLAPSAPPLQVQIDRIAEVSAEALVKTLHETVDKPATITVIINCGSRLLDDSCSDKITTSIYEHMAFPKDSGYDIRVNFKFVQYCRLKLEVTLSVSNPVRKRQRLV